MDFSTDVLAQTTIMPVDDLNIKLNIPSHEHIIYIKRLYSVENRPMILQETYIPVHICQSILEEDVKNNSLFGLLEKKYGIQITRVRNYFESTYLKADECKMFNLPENSSAVVLNQHFYSWKTQVMYTRSITVTDRCKFLLNFEKAL